MPTARRCVLAAAVLLVGAAGCTPAANGADPNTAPPGGSAALAELAHIPVKPAGSMTGYDRDEFGPAWADVDHNGCDTRDDILDRDLTRVYRDGDGCTVESGVLRDPYTNKLIRFRRGEGTSTAVQIDHLVPLADAWRTGARGWTAGKRERLANDPANLVASDGPTNESKGDQAASTWLPPAARYRCTYVTAQVHVKHRYGLWVTRAEHDAMARVLRRCGSPPSGPAPDTGHPSAASVDPDGTGAAPTVRPGSWCASPGTHARTSAGTEMVCRAAPGQQRPRWRSG